MREALLRHGFDVEEATEAAEALAAARQSSVELVGLTPSAADELEVARAIRREPGTRGIYVLALVSEERTGDLLEAGADSVVTWPCSGRELDLRLAAAVRVVELARELRLRARQSEQLNRLQSDFYSVVAHEIRTPMTAILSSAKILKRHVSREPEKVERFAGIIVEEGDRLLRLINNLLDLHRIESGRMEWHYEVDDVSRLVRHVADSFAGMASDAGVELELALPEERLELVVDSDKVVQVLGNLVANAIKHAPRDSAVRLSAHLDDQRAVQVSVEDRGPGVPESIRSALFQRFVRSDSGGVPGTGLGLAIARELIVRHGGSIGYEPRAGGGSRFEFRLPARPVAAEA